MDKLIVFITLFLPLVYITGFMVIDTIGNKERTTLQIWCSIEEVINIILFVIAFWGGK